MILSARSYCARRRSISPLVESSACAQLARVAPEPSQVRKPEEASVTSALAVPGMPGRQE